jgi:hypothetical protein
MSLPTDHSFSLYAVGGESENGGTLGEVAVLDSSIHQDMRWCANCGGSSLFVPVDRFPFGWRGYCLGCEEVVYVMDERTSVEVA